MRRILLAFVLVVAACGGSAAPTPDPAGDSAAAATAPSSTAGATTAPEPDTTGTAAGDATGSTVEERVRPDGPDAPDFTVTLADGSEFNLSAEQKPVYMVFWAEW